MFLIGLLMPFQFSSEPQVVQVFETFFFSKYIFRSSAAESGQDFQALLGQFLNIYCISSYVFFVH